MTASFVFLEAFVDGATRRWRRGMARRVDGVDGVAAAPPRDTVHTNETRAQDRAHRNADVRALEDANTETVAGAHVAALAGTFVYALGGPHFRADARAQL